MRLERLARWLRWRLLRNRGKADAIIPREGDPYLLRWHLIPRNPLFNVYLHAFLRSDDETMHDHSWPSVSLLLLGGYVDHSVDRAGQPTARYYSAGDLCFRLRGGRPHRIQIAVACWSLFITGPRYRAWGFHCPDRWVPWEEFTQGAGCE